MVRWSLPCDDEFKTKEEQNMVGCNITRGGSDIIPPKLNVPSIQQPFLTIITPKTFRMCSGFSIHHQIPFKMKIFTIIFKVILHGVVILWRRAEGTSNQTCINK